MSDLQQILKEEYEKSLAELMDPHALMSMIEEALAHSTDEVKLPFDPYSSPDSQRSLGGAREPIQKRHRSDFCFYH